jgi:hypothetical protein
MVGIYGRKTESFAGITPFPLPNIRVYWLHLNWANSATNIQRHTLGKAINRKLAMRVLGEEFECDVWLSLPNHEVDNNESFEDYRPC